MKWHKAKSTRWILFAVLLASLIISSIKNFGRAYKNHVFYTKSSTYCQTFFLQYQGYAEQFIREYKVFLRNPGLKPNLEFLSLAPPGEEQAFMEAGVSQNRELAKKFADDKSAFDSASGQFFSDFLGTVKFSDEQIKKFDSYKNQISSYRQPDDQL